MQQEIIAIAVIWAVYNRNNSHSASKLSFDNTDHTLSISKMSNSRIIFYLNNQNVTVNISGDNFDFNGGGVNGSGKVSDKEVLELTAESFTVYSSDIYFSDDNNFTVKSRPVRVY